ncbi:hypothetical protein [Clostridium cellulovorans]|uniref:BIG2 domain-containing protein n=1 Tax=Clostridium cellulovorans (strain ATCC 35296 / DSM 3052 / OCM 3 / 743B) TaxID=573061 RepID=D9SP60_CLOC7|nr:hypothetical protein [Clostridium cellulovorans]ADL52025.1 hypothetical protein Clocel_2299 [Clostridium cellulovorans 743B]
MKNGLKKLICSALVCATVFVSQAASVSAIGLQNNVTKSPIASAQYISNYYTLKVGQTQYLTGYSYSAYSSSNCATIETFGSMVLVNAKAPGTIVVYAYNENDSLRTVNYITIQW